MTDQALTLIRGDEPAADVLGGLDEVGFANLLHGLLAVYDTAARATRTALGQVALGAWLTDIAETDPNPDNRRGAQLISYYNAAMSDDDALFHFGADAFNAILDAADADKRASELLLAVAAVWRRLLPDLHTPAGLHALHAIAAEGP